MLSATKLTLCLVVGAPTVFAQSYGSSRIQPIRSTTRHAGVFDLRTGRFSATTKSSAATLTYYDNTCQATQSAYGLLECEDLYDEGRVPLAGMQSFWSYTYTLESIELAYCTTAPTGVVDIDWEIYYTYDHLGAGGSCSFGGAGVPPPFSAGAVGFDSSAAGFPLPGSTTAGAQGCWIVAFSGDTQPPLLTSGATSADQFVYRFSQSNTPAQLGGGSAGPLIAGSPALGVPGCGSFSIPPCTDPFTLGPCGNGLDNQDVLWLNTDGVAAGATPPATCSTGGVGPSTTTCTFFGGYPTNPHAGLWWKLDGQPQPDIPHTYCTAKVKSLGCTPNVFAYGNPTLFGCSNAFFKLRATNLVGNKNGLWFYGTNGVTGIPFQGGYLCVKPTIKRLSVQSTGGQGTACNGELMTDFNQRLCSGLDPTLVPGAPVATQCWSRDPASPSTTNLTAAVEFVVQP